VLVSGGGSCAVVVVVVVVVVVTSAPEETSFCFRERGWQGRMPQIKKFGSYHILTRNN
jgi:hypothetical protein